MIKKTLCFGNPAYLSVKDRQLVIDLKESESKPSTIPIEDIGIVILEHPQITITHGTLNMLMQNGAVVISSDNRHIPSGLMLPFEGHNETSEIIKAQLEASEPLKKQLWQQVTVAKIQNQASILSQRGLNAERLLYIVKQVRSGDPDNYEAQAAAYYWRTLFGYSWVRDPDIGPAPNFLLNYSYAIIRAMVARAIVGAGLLPILGIHHRNKYNAYCLADDLMEPFRPFADKMVLDLHDKGMAEEINKDNKSTILNLPIMDTMMKNEKSPMLIATQRCAASLASVYKGKSRKLLLPSF